MHNKLCLHAKGTVCAVHLGTESGNSNWFALKRHLKDEKLCWGFRWHKGEVYLKISFPLILKLKLGFVGCPPHLWWLDDSLCAVLILQCLMLIEMIQEEAKPLFRGLKMSSKYMFPEDVINANYSVQNTWLIWNHYWKKVWCLLTKYGSISL